MVTESPGTTGYLSHQEYRCAGVTRNTGMPESCGNQGCRIYPVSSESGAQVIWVLSKHVVRFTGVTGSGFESRTFKEESIMTFFLCQVLLHHICRNYTRHF